MEYLLAVNEHYKSQEFNEPSNRNNRFPASNLLDSAEESEGASAKQDPLNHKMIVLMDQMAQAGSLGFKAAVYDHITLGSIGGFCK